MDRYKKLLSNTLILTIGTFASKLLVYFLMPLYTAILSTEQYGTADLITNAANLLIPFCCIGITHGVFRFAADEDESNKVILSSGVSVLLISSAVFLLVSPLISFIPYFESYAWLIAFYVISSNFHTVAKEYIRAKGRMKLYAVQSILGTALVIAFNLLFLIPMKLGVVGYVLSVAVADAVGTVFLIIYAKLYKDFSFKIVSKIKIREMLKYSLPMMPTTVIWWITNVSDRFIVTAICGSGENGLYSAAYKIPTIIALVAGVFNEAWQLSAISESKDGEEVGNFFSEVFERYQAILFLGCSVLIPFTPLATRILLDESYFSAWSFMPVLLVATVFSSLVTFIGTIYTVKKRTTMSLITAAFGAGLNIVLNLLMIPSMGAQGAGIATAISYFAVFVLRAIHSKRFMPFNLKAWKVSLNTLIVIVQIIFMICGLPFNILVQVLMVGLIGLINGRSLVSAFMKILKKILKK
ncbi:MAG: oligosaccharide flippase family protein [Clostridia bacterium]|nr:oligosaccharide flippase family protein [Clostridia bacterium]